MFKFTNTISRGIVNSLTNARLLVGSRLSNVVEFSQSIFCRVFLCRQMLGRQPLFLVLT